MGNSASFRIASKAFFLAFDGGCMDSYSIIEKQGKHHGSIRVGRSGSGFNHCILGRVMLLEF